jgi:dsRNA-specific ribonuclease
METGAKARAAASSKRQAEQAAAKAMLARLDSAG